MDIGLQKDRGRRHWVKGISRTQGSLIAKDKKIPNCKQGWVRVAQNICFYLLVCKAEA